MSAPGDDGDEDGAADAGSSGQDVDLVVDPVGLQTHEQEDAALEDELDGLPVLLGESPVLGAHDRDAAARDEEPGDDRGDEAGPAEVLRGHRGEEGHDEGEDGVGRGIGDAPAHPGPELADDEADDDGDAEREEELPGHAPGGHLLSPGLPGRDGSGEEHERGRVVEEALALEDRDDAVVDAGASGDGDGDGVGGAEDGAERDRPGQGDGRDEGVDDDADDEGGDDDEPDGEARDAAQLAAEVHDGHGDGGAEEEGREDDLEDDLRVDLDGAHPRQEADEDPDRQKDERRGDADLGRELVAGGDDEQAEDRDEECHGRVYEVVRHVAVRPWGDRSQAQDRAMTRLRRERRDG